MNRPSPDDMKEIMKAEKNEFNKQTMRQWLYEIEKLKAENKRFEELLATKGSRRILVLIRENRELREKLEEVAQELIQHHEEYKNMADMVVKLKAERDQAEEDYRSLENAYEKLKGDIVYEEGLYD